jgi:hypothetical protein
MEPRPRKPVFIRRDLISRTKKNGAVISRPPPLGFTGDNCKSKTQFV